MRKTAVSAVAILVLMCSFSACTVFQSGKAVVKHEPGDTPRMTTAPYKGLYSLFDSSDSVAKVSHHLNAGEQIGFKNVEGRLLAIAGSSTHPVDDPSNSLYWRLTTKTEDE